jgi:hypothetical protein
MSDINFTTILADIRTGLGARDEEQRRRADKLKAVATNEFARLNGWQTGSTIYFPPENIGKRQSCYHNAERPLFDHCLYFRGNGRNAAIVSQPYAPDCRKQAAALATQLRIELHTPPILRASIWSPGDAFFLVFTERGHEMRWLPEQVQS